MKLVVGLGNPGGKYERTPHNVGFMAVDELARRAAAGWKRSHRFKALVARQALAGQDLVLVKPQTYMNRSGSAVVAVAGFYKVAATDVVIVFDDADLETGRLRVKPRGSSGGHRGLASVLEALGSQTVPRVRIGIGRGGDGRRPLVDQVLTSYTDEELAALEPVVMRAADAVERLLEAGTEAAMNAFNVRPSKDVGEQETDS